MSALFAAFDAHPSPKGASTHIAQSVRALQRTWAVVHVATLEGTRAAEAVEGLVPHAFVSREPDLLRRARDWGRWLVELVRGLPDLEMIHVRDAWSLEPLREAGCLVGRRVVFEMNGLPSVELPTRAPRVRQAPGLMERLRRLEVASLRASDRVIAVSEVGRRFAESLGVDAERIDVVPNHAHLPEGLPAPGTGNGLCYFGTLSAWQGFETLLEAWRLLDAAGDGSSLSVFASSPKGVSALRERAAREGWLGTLRIEQGLDRETLWREVAGCAVAVAPLRRCERNLVQGCSPLKLLEAMACGVPVVASDLPVCRELTVPEACVYVEPDSPRALAHALEALLADPERRAGMGGAGRAHVAQVHGEDGWMEAMVRVHGKACGPSGKEIR